MQYFFTSQGNFTTTFDGQLINKRFTYIENLEFSHNKNVYYNIALHKILKIVLRPKIQTDSTR